MKTYQSTSPLAREWRRTMFGNTLSHTLMSQSLILRPSYGNIFSITTQESDDTISSPSTETITIKTLSLRMADFRPEGGPWEASSFEVWLYTGSGDNIEYNENDLDDDPSNDNLVRPSKGEYQASRANFNDWILISEGLEKELLPDTDFFDNNGHIFNIGAGTTVGPLGSLDNYENMEEFTIAAREWNNKKLLDDGGMEVVTAEGEESYTYYLKIPEEKFMPLKLPKHDGRLTLFVTLDRVGLQYGYAAKQEFDRVDVTKHDFIDQTPSMDVFNDNLNLQMHVGEGVIFYPWMEEEFFYQTRRFLGKVWYEATIPCQYTPSPTGHPSIQPSSQISNQLDTDRAMLADCSTCDHTQTQEVYYGCSGDSAYIAYNDNRVECGQALTFDETSTIPKFYYPDAEADGLYTLLMMDTTGIDPIVGVQPPFLPFPIIHYGAVNIPGDHLVDGLSLDQFSRDDMGVRVTPFLSYQAPIPSEDLSKYQPGFDPPDINTRAFNYEFILGQQRRIEEDPLMDKNINWGFIGFLKSRVLFPPLGNIVSTYISSGYCVREVDDEMSAADCPVPAKTGSGFGNVPAHVAVDQGEAVPLATSTPSLPGTGESGTSEAPASTPAENGTLLGADLLISVLIKDEQLSTMPDDVKVIFEDTVLDFVNDELSDLCPLIWNEGVTVAKQEVSVVGELLAVLDVTTVINAFLNSNSCPNKKPEELVSLIEEFINNNQQELWEKLRAAHDYFTDAIGVSADAASSSQPYDDQTSSHPPSSQQSSQPSSQPSSQQSSQPSSQPSSQQSSQPATQPSKPEEDIFSGAKIINTNGLVVPIFVAFLCTLFSV